MMIDRKIRELAIMSLVTEGEGKENLYYNFGRGNKDYDKREKEIKMMIRKEEITTMIMEEEIKTIIRG